MKWPLRIFMLVIATLVFTLVLFFATLALLIALLRWLITGQKPSLTVHTNAYQQWKNMTTRRDRTSNHTDDVIEAEVREVPRDSNRLP
jgi:hypothetical protein